MVRWSTRSRGRIVAALTFTLVLSVAASAFAGPSEVPDVKSGTYGRREFPSGECVYGSGKGDRHADHESHVHQAIDGRDTRLRTHV